MRELLSLVATVATDFGDGSDEQRRRLLAKLCPNYILIDRKTALTLDERCRTWCFFTTPTATESHRHRRNPLRHCLHSLKPRQLFDALVDVAVKGGDAVLAIEQCADDHVGFGRWLGAFTDRGPEAVDDGAA